MKNIKLTFSLPDQTGVLQTQQNYKGKKVLIYCYPKDMTPGCTLETIGFQELKQDFEKNNTVIIGISKDSTSSHQKFCEKHSLDITLLSDESGEFLGNLGVIKEKSMFGKKYQGISRESFLFDEQGELVYHWEKVSPLSHPKQVLSYIEKQQ
jgi:thioredoxin-dependent peroxiredoxin